MHGVAITGHGCMYGVVEFFNVQDGAGQVLDRHGGLHGPRPPGRDRYLDVAAAGAVNV